MLYPEFKYVGYKSDLRAKTQVVHLDWVEHDSGPVEGKEYYKTIYRFDEGIKKYESVADLKPDLKFYSDYLVFDLDSSVLEEAWADAKHLCSALKSMGVGYELYFSGAKGFHVLVPSCQFGFEPTSDDGILKRMAELLASRYKSFDPSIYNKSRVFRIPDTVNLKTGLFKIPLIEDADYETSEILALAKEPVQLGISRKDPWSYPKVEMLCRLYERCKPTPIRTIQATDPKQSFTDSGIIRTATPGNRNNTLYGMARDLASHGIVERDALIMCNWWNATVVPPLSTEEVANTVASAYKKGVNVYAAPDNVFQFAFNSRRALDQVRTLYQNWGENSVKTGYSFLDKFTLGFFKEEVIFIISRPGNFKTCLLSNLLHGIALNTKRPSIFFSMEMSVEALTMRHIQKAERLSQSEVITGMRTGRSFPSFVEQFGSLFVVGLSSLNTDRIVQTLDKFREEHGQLGAIGFDYMSLFEGAANDTARTARMATELKTVVAKAAGCPTFVLTQAKEKYEGNKGDIELDRTAGKDSSSITDSGDYLMLAWGHWENGEKKIYGKFGKARKYLADEFPDDSPYFFVDVEKQYMNVKDIKYVPDPPRFKQLEDYQNAD